MSPILGCLVLLAALDTSGLSPMLLSCAVQHLMRRGGQQGEWDPRFPLLPTVA